MNVGSEALQSLRFWGSGRSRSSNIAAHAEPGVFDDRIVFGQSAAFDGPAAALGLGMREGILASFNEANAAGGVNGRRLELVSYDDGYEPEKAIANTKRLINENGVFALIGEVGTPTSNAAQPIATEAGVPFIGPFTGAAFLRNPSLGNVINIRASYDQETEAWIEHLTTDLGVSRIAILYQDDTFGRAGLSGVSKAMEKRGMKLVAEGTYERNTTAVKTALLAIRKAASRGRRHGRCLQAVRGVHQAGTPAQAERRLRQHLIRRRQRPRQGTRRGRQRSRGNSSRTIPRRHEHPARGPVPKGAQGSESGRADRLRLARGIHGRPIGHRSLGKGERSGYAGGPAFDHQGGRHVRSGWHHAGLWPRRQSGHGPGVPHRDPGGWQLQGSRPPEAMTTQADQGPYRRAAGRHQEPEARASAAARLGIKARLVLAFCAMAAMTAIASGVAWYAFVGIDRAVTQITTDSVPGMAASLRLAGMSAEIAATAPALMVSASQEERDRVQAQLEKRTKELITLTGGLQAAGVPRERIADLADIEGQITVRLRELDTAVKRRLGFQSTGGRRWSPISRAPTPSS